MPPCRILWKRTLLVQLREPTKSYDLGWLRWVGSIKLYVSLARDSYKRDYVLQKRPMILRSLLIVATSYSTDCFQRIARTSGTWLIHMWDMTHSYMGHDSFIYGTWLIHMWLIHIALTSGTWLIHMWLIHMWLEVCICDMTHSSMTWRIHVWRDSFTCAMIHMWHAVCICDMTPLSTTWRIHMCRDSFYMWHDSFKWEVTHFFVWYDSFICDMIYSCTTRLIHGWHDSFKCDMTHSYMTWLIHMCDMMHSYVWHDSSICYMTFLYATWLIHMWHDSFIYGMSHSYVTHEVFGIECTFPVLFWTEVNSSLIATTQMYCMCITRHGWDSHKWSQSHIQHPADTQNSFEWVSVVEENGVVTNLLGSGLEMLVDAMDRARFKSGSWW